MIEETTWECYRHPGREGGVRCRRCERPICPDCMVPASVGFQCPGCVKAAPATRPLRSLRRDPQVVWVLVALNVLAFLPALAEGALMRTSNPLAADFALFGPAVAAGEWWRLVTSGFLHYGLLHLGLNMLVLTRLGQLLEPSVGRARFVAVYAVSLLGGSFGALLLSPDDLTAGASGAVYGLMGATVAIMHRRGVDIMQSGFGGLILVNLAFTFLVPGISIGGHLGGLVAGAAAGAVLEATEGRDASRRALGLAACAALGGAALLGGVLIA